MLDPKTVTNRGPRNDQLYFHETALVLSKARCRPPEAVAEFILVRGIMRATLVTFGSISITLAYSQQAPASPRMTVFGRWYRGGPEVET